MPELAEAWMLFGVPLGFVATALLIELTPGPNMAYLAMLTLGEGRRAGFAAVAGVATGLLAIGILASFGLSTLIAESPTLYQILRWGGVLYLIWLAVDAWRGGDIDAKGEVDLPLGAYFRRGFITNLLNPKAFVFYVAVLPPFVDLAKPVLAQSIAMCVTYVAVATAVHILIVAFAAQAHPALANSGRFTDVRRALALSIGIVALWLAWSTRPR
ncbi:MAG: LysE family translocator [Hyphomicrobium sp.]